MDIGADGARLLESAATLTPPPTILSPPWLHQVAGYHFAISRRGSHLAFDMGTGKSRMAIDVMVNDPIAHRRILIACPLDVIPVWESQLKTHCAVPYATLPLDDRWTVKRRRAELDEFIQAGAGGTRGTLRIVLVNYEGAWREPLGAALRTAFQPSLVILDECHRIKAAGGSASNWCAHLTKAPWVKRVLGLTGTPMPHSPLDLYGQCRAIDPRVFGTSFARFRGRFAITRQLPGTMTWIVDGFQNQRELYERWSEIAIEVRKGDVLPDLPKVTHVVRPVTLDRKTAKLYRDLREQMIADVGSSGGVVTATNVMVKILRLQQVTGGCVPVEDPDDPTHRVPTTVGTEKADALASILADLPPSERLVVVCRFHADMDTVRSVSATADREVFEVSGRRKQLAEWQAARGGPILVAQIRAGSLGIDLTRACYGVMYSVGHSLGDYEQMLARLDRAGQKRPVTWFHLVATGTIDESVYKALRQRAVDVRAILDGLMRRET